MTRPTVSVVMSTYGMEHFLADSVRSVLAQTFADLELIVINDGSPGDPEPIIRELDDGRIVYLEHANCGQSRSKNMGIRVSRGEFVAFCDSDDLWLPDKLEKQLALFACRPELDVVYSGRVSVDGEGRVIENAYAPRMFEGWVLDRMYEDNFVCLSSAVVRRHVFDSVGMFDGSYPISQDFDLWLRVACKHRFGFVDAPLVKYRLHGGQMSRHTGWRVDTVWEIRRRFDEVWGHLVSPRARARARALHHSQKADRAARSGGARRETLPGYLRALKEYPFYGPAYRGLARALAPRPVLDAARRLRDLLAG